MEKKTKIKLTSEYATREKLEFLNRLMTVLPDPDEILAENGYDFKIYRDLLTDPHLTATVQQRKLQILQMDWEVDESTRLSSGLSSNVNSAKGQAGLRIGEIKKKAEKILNALPLQRIMSEILDCILFGMTVQEITYAYNSNGELDPIKIEAKPQEWFIFTIENELRLRKKSSAGIYLFEEGEPLPEFKFIVNRFHATYDNPYGDKILSRCYWPITFKRAATEFWQLMVERYGMPFLIGYHPAGWTQAQVDGFMDQLKEMISENVYAFPDTLKDMIELKESPQYDIGQLYDILIKHHNTEISKAVLTVTLTTDMQGVGSYKAAEIHKEMLSYIGLSDKKIVEDGINRILQYWTFLNWGYTDAPKIRLKKKEKIVDESEKRDEVLSKIGVKFTKEYFKKRYRLEDSDFELTDVKGQMSIVKGKEQQK
ncbi:MAG TPA: DUF935 family protein [Ignavibacteriaceae bacterium]|nr:DUF935 family protein [Ignavibacteriaceae bacterium]